ncbi:MAG: cbb3-type cytochrome c oxidase subunit II [Candidatus Thiodiazotropha sp. (ex Monitilora ramsayi)]|nr:cbb3-type cytochrome c oxidase subunit II [Candidatus Thiodiazotropha sp. (ex Monitilora ramsayi)]
MNLRSVALIAGVFFFFLAVFTQGILPMVEPQSRYTKITKVVRTDLGELKWMESEATDYSELQALGRRVYTRDGCWYCHSQYVRPVTGETRRWGPVTQAGEYAYDLPHMFSTRRIGPDLSRVGLKYSDDWHRAHFWDPRMVVPDSIMPRYVGLFDGPYGPVPIVEDERGDRTLQQSQELEALFDFTSKEKILLTPNEEGLVHVKERGKYPVIFTPNDEFTGEAVTLVADTEELKGLIAYLQKLGTNRGKWRDRFAPQRLDASLVSIPRSEEWINYGKNVYQRRCEGCHGAKGDGNGPAAAFMPTDRPRNFALGVFKFRLTPSGSMPNDGDLLRTITRGLRGTAMPTWHNLPEKDRLGVIQYIKYVLAADRSDLDNPYFYFVEEPPEPPLHIGQPPPPSEAIVARGKEIWQQAKCWECHGDTGKGDGEKADELADDFGFPILPADLTTGQFKSGPGVEDIFRTISTGLSGTPMPSFKDTVSEEDRWALSYFVIALSAFKDPLTGEPLEISPADRAALNDPGLKADESHYAYKTKSSEEADTFYAGGSAWANKHGIEVSSINSAIK